ncbi:MAG: TonB-dependent receptor [Gammaproteobacteria bacterium]|nr:TonB-dependent receptor [Gammaproteobacteria bacterium]MDH5801980.1 TonB-dependent receptor [Gammaproteobacteria bacterium]
MKNYVGNQFSRWLLGMTLGFSQGAIANEFSEDDFLADIPVVVSASRLSQPKSDSPASITIINREIIDASGAVELVDILRLIPGFQVAHVSGNSFAVTYHGLSFGFPRKFQVMVDGRSVYRPLLSNVDWANLGVALENVDRIEVVRGPNAPAYGSNAFLGSINIVTRQAFEDHGSLFKVIRGTQRTDNVLMRHSDSLGDLDYRVTVRSQRDEGFNAVVDDKTVKDVDIRGQYTRSQRNLLDWSLGYVHGQLGLGFENNPLDPAREKDVRSSHAHLRWTRTQSNTDEFFVQLFYNRHEQRDEYTVDTAVLGLPSELVNVGQQDGLADRTELEAQHNIRPFAGMRFAWGGSMRRDRIKGQYILDKEGYISARSANVFFNGEWQLWDPVLLNFGYMVEQSDHRRRFNSPRLALNYKLNSNHTFRVSGSRAHRAPSLFEANHRWVIRDSAGSAYVLYASDPNLQPEKIISLEAAYLAELPQWNITFDMKLFKEELRNLILAPEDSGGTKVWSNNGYADTEGVEFQLGYQPWSRFKVGLQYSYAKTRGVLMSKINPNVVTDAADNVPRHTLSFNLRHDLNSNWWGSLSFYHVSDMEWEGDGDYIDGYSRWDAQIVKKLRFGLDSSSARFIIHNVLDDEYAEFRKENTFGRRFYIKFSADF